MKCVLLAAGTGSRMNMSKSKSLLPLWGENILERLIRQLKANGINDITVAISVQKQLEFAEHGPKNVDYKVVLNRDFECLSTLMQVKKYLTYPLLILHADVIMANETMEEILSEPHDGMMFIGDKADIFCVLVDDERHLKNFNLPFKCTDVTGFTAIINKYKGKLWHMYWRFNRKFYIPRNYIADVDYEQKYKQVKKFIKEHKI